MTTRDQRLLEELAFYRDYAEVHDLPPIYHVWSERFVAPKLRAVGYGSLEDMWLFHLSAATERTSGEPVSVVSLGAGNCDLEIDLAACFRGRSDAPMLIDCIEINAEMTERGRHEAVSRGVAECLSFEAVDLNEWRPRHGYDVCLVNHSLHHVVELEHLLDSVREAIGNTGVFLVNDMVGRNGHMRWPEALEILQRIWAAMPDRYKHNRLLQRFESEYENWDCSTEGFEGIRAQDILPLLVERFSFEVFVAFGNVSDVFVDRCFGHNLDPARDDDVEFITRVGELDDLAIDLGVVKPTHVIASLRSEVRSEPRCYRHWTPGFCVRTLEASRPVALSSSDAAVRRSAAVTQTGATAERRDASGFVDRLIRRALGQPRVRRALRRLGPVAELEDRIAGLRAEVDRLRAEAAQHGP